jgi:hypothetical protein
MVEITRGAELSLTAVSDLLFYRRTETWSPARRGIMRAHKTQFFSKEWVSKLLE